MIKKSITIMLGLLSIFFFITACNTESPEETKQENPTNETQQPSKPDDSEGDNIKITAPEANLQKKDQGESVQLLQNALNKIGYSLQTDGNYEDSTIWAITDFQLQHDNLLATGVYNEATKEVLEDLLTKKEREFKPGNGLPVEAEQAMTDDGSIILANPYDQLALVNKENALPADFIPEDLVIPNVRFPFTEDLPKKQMREVAANALENMFAAADKAGLDLFAQSGYRSYDRQDAIFATNVNRHGEEAANKFSARPGESEHQTGLTMDVTSPDVNYELIIEFGDTDEGKWIKEHATEYGFIIRYPEGKEEITQYQYEPWHLRYVGKKVAKEIMSQEITLEEYLEAR